MTGSAKLKAKIEIPEGDGDLLERLKIDGRFDADDAHFTSEGVQGEVDSLSRRGQGQPKAADVGDTRSELHGSFKVDEETVTFSHLSFGVPGASITVSGNYDLDNGEMNLRGKLRLKAKLSQTTTGVKVTGTRDKPLFGLDFRDKANKE